jgi:RimJ/RimL family protein N-acetyltransferase
MQPLRIETKRLVLDAHTLADFEPMLAMRSDPEVIRYVGGVPATGEECWMRLLRYRGLWPLLGYGYWAVREKSSGRYAGEIGFADFHRPVEPSILGVPEAGWVLARWAHGHGFASEALAAALAWLDHATQHRRSVCLIDPANAASIRVAGKAGFGGAQMVRFRDSETLLLERVR